MPVTLFVRLRKPSILLFLYRDPNSMTMILSQSLITQFNRTSHYCVVVCQSSSCRSSHHHWRPTIPYRRSRTRSDIDIVSNVKTLTWGGGFIKRGLAQHRRWGPPFPL